MMDYFKKTSVNRQTKKNTKLCPHDSNRNHFDHSIALDGVYFIETNGRNRSLSSDLFPRKKSYGKTIWIRLPPFLFGAMQEIHYSSLC